MANKVSEAETQKMRAMDDVMVLLEILHQLDDVDLLGRGVDLKIKVIDRIEEELNKI